MIQYNKEMKGIWIMNYIRTDNSELYIVSSKSLRINF